MTSSNRVRLTGVAETTFGITPDTPRMRLQRVTSIGLTNKTDYVDSDELRPDRMSADPIPVGETNDGNIGIEWHFPPAGSLLRSEIQSAFCSHFVETPKEKAAGSVAFMGMRGAVSTTTLDASPDAAPALADYPVMAFSAHCGRVGYGGTALGSPNWAKSIKFTLNNNLRPIEAVADSDATAPGPVDIQDGSLDVSVELDTFFGNSSVLADIKAGTQRGVNTRLFRGGRAMIWEAPRITPREGDPTVGGKNQDVMLPVRGTASADALTGAQIILNLLEYAEE